MIWVWSDHCVSAAIHVVASCASHDIELVTIIIFTAIVAKGGSGYARLAIGVVEQVWCASVPSHNSLAMPRLGTCVVSHSHTPFCYSTGGSGQLL